MLLDTQAAVWLAIGQHLGRQTQKLVNQALSDDRLAMSAVSFWEMAMLIAKRRLRTRKSAGELRAELIVAGIRELPLTGEIAILAGELEGLNGDPADRMIAATAIVHDAILVTADAKLLRWRHRVKRQDAER
jgi:PIN domain nuclease of toxin-antitoxin system